MDLSVILTVARRYVVRPLIAGAIGFVAAKTGVEMGAEVVEPLTAAATVGGYELVRQAVVTVRKRIRK